MIELHSRRLVEKKDNLDAIVDTLKALAASATAVAVGVAVAKQAKRQGCLEGLRGGRDKFEELLDEASNEVDRAIEVFKGRTGGKSTARGIFRARGRIMQETRDKLDEIIADAENWRSRGKPDPAKEGNCRKYGQALKAVSMTAIDGLADVVEGNVEQREASQAPAEEVQTILAGLLAGRFAIMARWGVKTMRAAAQGASAVVGAFTGWIQEQNAQGASAEEIAEMLEEKPEFNRLSGLEALDRLENRLASICETHRLKGPVKPCPTVEAVDADVREAVRQSADSLLISPEDVNGDFLPNCGVRVSELRERCRASETP